MKYLIWIIILFALLLLFDRDIEYYSNQSNESDLLNIVDGLVFINCDHRTDRKEQFLSQFSGNDLKKIHRLSCSYIPENPEYGCMMSHIRVLEYAKKYFSDKPDSYIFIAEDDLKIIDTRRYIDAVVQMMNCTIEWDVLMIGHNSIAVESSEIKDIIRTTNSQTASGYIIRYKYIDKLLSVYYKAHDNYLRDKIWKPLEYCSDQSWKKLQSVDKWYAINPRVAIQRESYSDIQKGNVNYDL